MTDYNPTAQLVGEGVLSGELFMTQGALHNEFVGEGVLQGWLRQANGMFRGTFTDEADLPVIARVKGDWAEITPADGLHSYSVVWDGTATWVPSYVTKQGPIIASPEPIGSVAYYGAMKPQMGDSVYPFRIWNEVDTTVANQPFHVDAAGNIRLAGGIQASSIDIPATATIGFHVNSSGGVNAGGTSAVGVAAGNVAADGSFYLTGSGEFATAAPATYPRTVFKAGTGGAALVWYPSSGAVSNTQLQGRLSFATGQASLQAAAPTGLDYETDITAIAVDTPSDFDDLARAGLWVEVGNAVGGGVVPYTALAGGALVLEDATTTPYFDGQSPGEVRIAADSSLGNSYTRPYYRNEAGETHNWLRTVDVVTQAMAFAKGDLIAATADDAWARLAVGSDGQVLTADSSASRGVNWANVAAAPTTADYLVGTATAGLSAEIVAGTSPGGELGGSWGSPTVDSTHSGSPHRSLAATATLANVPASQASLRIGIGAIPTVVSMPYAGSIVAMSAGVSEARLTGSITVTVFKNNVTTGFAVTIDGTNTVSNNSTQAAGSDTFVAGDVLDIRLVSSTWSPTTSDIYVQVWVQWSA